jgi:TetR/AcrR family transcriptional repressor of nem operon
MFMPKAEQTRLHIIDKAARIFNQKGYMGTSMYDIVEATGLSKGGVYGNFKNKEAIALAAFDHAVHTVWQQVRERTSRVDNYLDKLIEVVAFYKERVLNPPIEGGCPIQNRAAEVGEHLPALKKKVMSVMDLWIASIARTVEKGKARGHITPDVDSKAFAIQFISTLEGGIMLSQLYDDVYYYEQNAKQLKAMIASIRQDNR